MILICEQLACTFSTSMQVHHDYCTCIEHRERDSLTICILTAVGLQHQSPTTCSQLAVVNFPLMHIALLVGPQ